jgi:hypothetical protein
MEGSFSIGTVEVGAVELKDDSTTAHARVLVGTQLTTAMPMLGVYPTGGTLNQLGTVTYISAGSIGTLGTMSRLDTLGTIGTMASLTKAETVGTVEFISAGSIGTLGTMSRLDTLGTVGTLDHINRIDTIGTLQCLNTDIELGAVELKDGTNDTRARIINGSDIAGTMESLAVAVSAGTVNSIGTVSFISAGSIGTLGTMSNLASLSAGTITSISAGSIGTLGTLAGVSQIDNLSSVDLVDAIGSIGTLNFISAGSIGTLGTMSNLASGTINAGTFTVSNGIDVDANNAGVVAIQDGTTDGLRVGVDASNRLKVLIGDGTLAQLTAGTITSISAGTLGNVASLTAGTITSMPTLNVGTLADISFSRASTGTSGQGTIGTTCAIAIASSATRKQAHIQNIGTTILYVGFGSTLGTLEGLGTDSGWKLKEDGEKLFDRYTGDIYVVGSGATGSYAYMAF